MHPWSWFPSICQGRGSPKLTNHQKKRKSWAPLQLISLLKANSQFGTMSEKWIGSQYVLKYCQPTPNTQGDPRGSQAVLPLRYSAQGNSAMRRHSPRRYYVQIVSYAWGSRWRQQWGIHKNQLNQSWPWTMDIHGKCSWGKIMDMTWSDNHPWDA